MRIHITEQTKQCLDQLGGYVVELRGQLEIKASEHTLHDEHCAPLLADTSGKSGKGGRLKLLLHLLCAGQGRHEHVLARGQGRGRGSRGQLADRRVPPSGCRASGRGARVHQLAPGVAGFGRRRHEYGLELRGEGVKWNEAASPLCFRINE